MDNNSEKQIAQTIMDAQKMREESHSEELEEYKHDIEYCLIICGKKNKLTPNLWALLSLAMHWWNDTQLWAEDILADRNINENTMITDTKIKNALST